MMTSINVCVANVFLFRFFDEIDCKESFVLSNFNRAKSRRFYNRSNTFIFINNVPFTKDFISIVFLLCRSVHTLFISTESFTEAETTDRMFFVYFIIIIRLFLLLFQLNVSLKSTPETRQHYNPAKLMNTTFFLSHSGKLLSCWKNTHSQIES